MTRLLNQMGWKIGTWPLSLLYRAVVQTRNFCYDKQWLSSKSLSARVISIGNITVGGTGKTPLVINLASFLLEKGFRVGVLSRGYRRKNSGEQTTVVSDGNAILSSAADAGDEPVLLAERLPGVPVIVSRNRAEAGIHAIEQFGCNLLILDDGFQHRKIKRDLDIIIVDAANPWGNRGMLPAGPLREPMRNLQRADVIVLSRTNETNNLENLLIQIGSLSKAPICFAIHKPQAWIDLNNGTNRPLCFLKKKCVVAFCGIGNPDSFARTLKNLDVQIIRFFTYRDHHRYTIHELERMTELAQSKCAVALVTTEKDRVRIPSEFTNNIPVYILKIEMALRGGRETLETLVQSVMVSRKGTKE